MNRSPIPYRLPDLTPENLKAIMDERMISAKNGSTSIPMLWQGLLEIKVKVEEDTCRTAKLYVPKDTPQGTAFVLLNVPEGWETVSFLEDSGWLTCAERCQLPVFAAEPGPDGWKSPAEEQAYVDACAKALFGGIYIRAGMSVYVVGYGSIGTCLHQYVLENPLRVAGAVFANASDLEDAAIEKAQAADLSGEGMTFDIPKRDIPVPVWILESRMSAQAERTAAHWLQAIEAGPPTEDPILGTVYKQKRKSICTPDGCIAQVCVKAMKTACPAPAVTDTICHFLRQYARYNKFGPYGNSLVPYVDYEAAGVDVRYYRDCGGDLRECLIYVPKGGSCGEKLPLVFAVHGSSESVRNYFEESLLYRKADRERFIVIMPETALYPMPHELSGGVPMAYRPRWEFCSSKCSEVTGCAKNDLEYFDRVLTSVVAEYPVDESRIYATGHSNGFMMTSLLASSPYGRRFAAIAVTSGVTTVWDDQGTEKIPVYMTMGEYDLWSHDLRDDNGLTQGIDLWLVRNGMATTEDARAVRVSGASESFLTGRHHCTVWKNGKGIPMIRYDWIAMKDHMNTADENNMFWDEWFSKWTLDKEKGRCYEGRPI